MAYRPSSLLRAPNPMVGIASSTCPSGRPASLVTLPVIVTGSCAASPVLRYGASRAGRARNALRMMGTTRLRVSCMSPPAVSVTSTTGDAHVGVPVSTTYTTPSEDARTTTAGTAEGARLTVTRVAGPHRHGVGHLYHQFATRARAPWARLASQSGTGASFGSHTPVVASRPWLASAVSHLRPSLSCSSPVQPASSST